MGSLGSFDTKASICSHYSDYMDRFLDEQENMTLSVMNSLPNNSGLSNTMTSSSHNSNSLMHSSSSSNHHINLNHLSSSSSGRQSSSSLGLNNSAQTSRHHSSHHHHSSSHHHDSYTTSNNSVTISGPNMRTINVSATGEPQTILINDADFNGSNQSKSGSGASFRWRAG